MAVIAIDFDHTLVEGAEPKPGAKNAINLLRELGHKIVIHSCNDPKWIKNTLDNNDIRYDHIWTEAGKPLADMYVDDKGFRFFSWKSDVDSIKNLLHGMDNRKWPVKNQTSTELALASN